MATSYAYTRRNRLLTVSDLCLAYGNQQILHDINISIDDIHREGLQQGQVVALLGPSGIGKTQLFRLLAWLQKPTSGKILITENLVPVEAGMVGVVAQNYLLFHHRTVLGNLLVAARQRGSSDKEAREKAKSLLAAYGLDDRMDYYPAQLSGGQRQRVAIIQQILSSSHFLLMDEPFSGLDPIMKDRACNTIIQLSQADELNTIIVVTHDIESAVAIADTVWLMGRTHGADGAYAGATVIKQYDLIELGLAWHPEIQQMPQFHEVVIAIKNEFKQC
jgi:ABC-type nitrate/sulfonate/bicarbonate transport system ATPase subunit